MKKIITIIIISLLLIFAAIRLLSVRSKNLSQNSELYNIDKVSVVVTGVIVKNASFSLFFTGTLFPIKELNIPAETQGKITSLNFKLGQRVSSGSVIAKIDAVLKNIDLQTAETEAEKLKKDFIRTRNLFNNQVASEQELDDSRIKYENALFRLNETKKQLALTNITSSIPGIISKKYVELGSYVSSGTIIATVVNISMLKVHVYVSEDDVYNLKLKQRAELRTDIYPDRVFEGRISFISPKSDDSHRYLVEIEMKNSGYDPLKAGTFVNVKIDIITNARHMYIPREALQGSVKNAKVFLAHNGKARLRNIIIGKSADDYLEVLSGLNSYDKVIVSGQINLVDGRSIKVINN